MSTVICQNYQSCFEPRSLRHQVSSNQISFLFDASSSPVLIESNSKTVELRKSSGYINNNNKEKNKNELKTSFEDESLIDSLTKEVEEKKETNYVHPMVKRSSSSLSEKSLELCTENLGGETSNNIEISEDLNLSTHSNLASPTRERSNSLQSWVHEKVKKRPFPPPLTSISKCDSVQYRPYREGGRLVIKAITVVNSTTCFQAERGNGRLRLLLKEPLEEQRQEEQQEEQEHEIREEFEGNEEDESKDGYSGEEVERNKADNEWESGNFTRPSNRRCSITGSSNRELSKKWEHFCVAT